MGIKVVPATPKRWNDVVAVMGERGDPSRCWCQYFRLRGKAWDNSSTDANRDALSEQVHSRPPPGVLAYDDGTPCGWCAIAPRTSYPRVLASRHWQSDEDVDGVWTVTCFVVPVGYRRRGVAGHLLRGAVELARSKGATSVEGNAVDLGAAGRVASADLYRGPLSVFLDEGFTVVRRNAAAWVQVRRQL